MSNIPKPVPVAEVQTYHDLHGHELLRHMRKLPTLLYGIFVEITRQLYSNGENHPLGTPVKIWNTNPEESEIWIDTELRWEDEHPEKRPAIYVQLSPITYASLTGRKDGWMGNDLRDSELYFTRSGEGRVSFVHIAGSAGEACSLADSTLDYLDAFSMVIRDDFCFTTFELVERVPLKQMQKESKERYGSVVAFKFVLQDRWTLKLEAERLKVLTFRAGQRLMDSGIVQ